MCLILLYSCDKEKTTPLSESVTSKVKQSLTSDTISGRSESKIKQALLMQNEVNNTALLTYSSLNLQPVKLKCITESLDYLAFTADNYELNAIIQNNILYVNIPEYDLIRQCESILSSQSFPFKLTKLAIRFNALDYEIENTTTLSKTYKITQDFIDSLITEPISIELYCSTNDEKLDLKFNAKTYFDNIIDSKSNILFIYIDKLTMQNSEYKFKNITFNDCKDNLYALFNKNKYENIYFIDDKLSGSNSVVDFLTQSSSSTNENLNSAYLVCYFIDENKKLNWHWAYGYDRAFQKFQVMGKWNDGIFETNMNKAFLEKMCTNSYVKYTEGEWKLFNIRATNNNWSWDSDIKISNSSSNLNHVSTKILPFDKIVVFGDNSAENGYSKQFSQQIVQRLSQEPSYPYFGGRYTGGLTFAESLSYYLNIPLLNWANIKNPLVEKQNYDSYFSNTITKYLKESNIWGGGLQKDKILYLFHVNGNYFTNSKGSPSGIFNNLSQDLKSAINKLVEAGAVNIVLPYVYNPKHLFASMKQIEPSNYEKYNKLLDASFDDVVINTLSDSTSRSRIIGIPVLSFSLSLYNNSSDYGFQNIESPCYIPPPIDSKTNLIFNLDNESSLTIKKGSVCQKQSQYLYFDNIHLGATANSTLAWYAAQYLTQNLYSPNNKFSKINLSPNDYYNKIFLSHNNPFLNFLLEKVDTDAVN